MFFRNTCFKEQLSGIASLGREKVLAQTVGIEMCSLLEQKLNIICFPPKGAVKLRIIKFTTIIQTSS